MTLEKVFPLSITKVLLLSLMLVRVPARAQSAPEPAPAPDTVAQSGLAVYRDLLNPVLDAADVHTIRQASLDREDLHLSLSDGTVALIRAVDGHITGAVFEGVGEILLIAPTRSERTSLALFTGSAILEQRFTTAYLRFTDDSMARDLQAAFRAPPKDEAQDFVARWQAPLRDLARGDALQLFQALSNSGDASSRFVHARLGGTQLGIFDVYLDTNSQEQISVAQPAISNKQAFYDVWASFPMRSLRDSAASASAPQQPRFELSDYRLNVVVSPPSDLSAQAEFSITAHRAGQRVVILELSRYLRVSEVRMDGKPVAIIQNEAISGSDLERRGDDLVGLLLPEPLQKDQPARLAFKYAGPVMFEAGGDLLYVGSRGTWYPNAGPMFSKFDLTFDYPEDWTLVATGKESTTSVNAGRRTTRFVAEKPISRAGFNLGRFETADATVDGVVIRAHASRNVEQGLAAREERAGQSPDPAREVQQIAAQAGNTVHFLANELDPFPYPNLEVTQLPGMLSQSWPGLIYLSSMAFLDADERHAAGVRDPYVDLLLSKLMLAHETGHQWWGDAVDWVSYRDEWIIEALANYSALLMLERTDPAAMKTALDYYRNELLRPTNNGTLSEAGAVTLGPRLTSSKFPDAYVKVLYGRGTWLIHMLRMMLRQATGSKDDALFFRALRGLLASSPRHKISTHDLQVAFEQVLPPSLDYEKKKSLEWFFDTWVNGAAIPQFSLERVRLVPGQGRMRVTGTIRQKYGAKDMVTAVPVYGVDAAGRSRFLAFVFADDEQTDFRISAPLGTHHLVLDPENTVLRR